MSGARVFLGHRERDQLRLLEVWTYEDAGRFPWTFLARNLPTIADIGLRKLVKLLGRIPAGKEAQGVGKEAIEEWLPAPKAFGLTNGPTGDLLRAVPDLSRGYPVGLVLCSDDNMVDVFRPGVSATGRFSAPKDAARYLDEPRYACVLRVRPRELRAVAQELAARLDGRTRPMPDHLFWEEALLRNEDASVLEVQEGRSDDPAITPEQLAMEEAINRDDRRTLRFLLDEGTDPEIALSWRVHGWRPVTLAARRGATSCLATLLDLGVEVGPDEIERAAAAGHPEVVRLILERRPHLRPKPRRRFFPGDGDGFGFFVPETPESSDPGQASPP